MNQAHTRSAMALVYRALLVLVLVGYAMAALASPRFADAGAQAGLHQRIGLLAALFGAFVQCLPLSYFAGSAYFVKYHADAAGAGPQWKQRHSLWMKDRAYPVMFLSVFAAFATAAAGGLVDTGRMSAGWHAALATLAFGLCLLCMAWLPPLMRWNAVLLRELIATHRAPRPGSTEAAELRARIRTASVPPMFQLARILIFAALSLLGLRLYLRFGTEGFRDVSRLPFAVLAGVLIIFGVRWHARHHPEGVRSVKGVLAQVLLLGSVFVASLAV